MSMRTLPKSRRDLGDLLLARGSEANPIWLVAAKDNPTVTHKNAARSDYELETQAGQMASKVFDQLSGRSNTGLNLDYEITAGTAGDHLKGRKVLIPDSDLASRGSISTNIFHILDRYTRTAGTDAALGKTFTIRVPKKDPITGKLLGPEVPEADAFDMKPDVGMKERFKEIRAEYDNMIADAPNAAKKDLIERERNRVLDSLQSIHDIHRGKYLLGVSNPLLNKMTESLGIINFLRAMGGTVISSFTDPFNLVMAHGLGATFRNGILPMIRDFHQAYWAGDSRR